MSRRFHTSTRFERQAQCSMLRLSRRGGGGAAAQASPDVEPQVASIRLRPVHDAAAEQSRQRQRCTTSSRWWWVARDGGQQGVRSVADGGGCEQPRLPAASRYKSLYLGECSPQCRQGAEQCSVNCWYAHRRSDVNGAADWAAAAPSQFCRRACLGRAFSTPCCCSVAAPACPAAAAGAGWLPWAKRGLLPSLPAVEEAFQGRACGTIHALQPCYRCPTA